MQEIAKCQNVALAKHLNNWFIVEDGVVIQQWLSQNDAFLIFKDYMAQYVYLGEAKLNFELVGK